MTKVFTLIGAVVSAAAAIFILAALASLPVKWIWNDLCPTLFGLRSITLWQAWEILFLSGILFRTLGYSTGD